MAMDAFSASLMQDKREIIIAPTIYKFANFGEFAAQFDLGERDVVLTNEFIYKPFMEELGLKSKFVFQENYRHRRRRDHGPLQAARLQAPVFCT